MMAKINHYQQQVQYFLTKFDKFCHMHQIDVQDKQLFVQAFSHSSFANDFHLGYLAHNERLEFLGDAILELTVSQYLFNRFPNKPEGELTKMRATVVCEPSLVILAKQLNFNHLLLLGRGEEKTGGRERPSILADVFEAFIGALYLNSGIEAVNVFLQKIMFPMIDKGEIFVHFDSKTQLQELVQGKGWPTAIYRLVSESGPAHHKLFECEVLINQTSYGTGKGRTKKDAEQNAAKQAIKKLQN